MENRNEKKSLKRVLIFAIATILVIVSFWWVGVKLAEPIKPTPTASIKPISKKDITLADLDHRDAMIICPGTISALFFHPIDAINIDRIERGIMYLSYKRISDNTEWKQRCKIEGNKVIWAANWDPKEGRWRTGPYDEVITYQIAEEQITIKQVFSDQSELVKKFDRF